MPNAPTARAEPSDNDRPNSDGSPSGSIATGASAGSNGAPSAAQCSVAVLNCPRAIRSACAASVRSAASRPSRTGSCASRISAASAGAIVSRVSSSRSAG
jgi:hypothetical protein